MTTRRRLASCRGGDLATGVHHVSDEPGLDRVGTDAGVKARLRRGERCDAPAASWLGVVGALVHSQAHQHEETRVGAGAVDRGFALGRGGAGGVSVESTVDDCDVCVVLPAAGPNA